MKTKTWTLLFLTTTLALAVVGGFWFLIQSDRNKAQVAGTQAGASFDLSNASFGEVASADGPHPSDPTPIPTSTTPFEKFDSQRDVGSAMRPTDEIMQEWFFISGSTPSISWEEAQEKLAEQSTFALTSVLTHYENLSSNPLNILFTHIFASPEKVEESYTYFSRRTNEPEEKAARASLLLARQLELSESPHFTKASKLVRYSFSIERHGFHRASDLRAPEGRGESHRANENHFNPLAIIAPENYFEQSGEGFYSAEINWFDKIYDVQVMIRKTEFDTLTVEIKTREKDTLSHKNFLLTYEASNEVTGQIINKVAGK